MTKRINEEQEIRRIQTIVWEDPAKVAQTRKTMSGLKYLQAVQSGKFSPSPVDILVGTSIVEVNENRVVFTMTAEEYHYGSFGTVQNGIVAALLDITLSSALQTTLTADSGYMTIDMNVRYMHPLTRETGVFYCEGNVIDVSGNIANIGANLTDKTKKIYAHATATFMVQHPKIKK